MKQARSKLRILEEVTGGETSSRSQQNGFRAITTIAILWGILMLSSFSSLAGKPQKVLTFFAPEWIMMEIPVKDEVAEEFPYEMSLLMKQVYQSYKDSIINQQFDLGDMIKPEPDANDMEIDTRAVFREVMGTHASRPGN